MKIIQPKNRRFIHKIGSQILAVFLCFILNVFSSYAQCPVNIDFENGTFDGWQCYSGNVHESLGENIITLTPVAGPVTGLHTMLSAAPGDGLDEYGGFPKNCPNGSGHSIKLGNDEAGGKSEGVSYQFVVPLTANKFTLAYNYAVVFEDPNHAPEKQPRLEIQVINVTDDEVINCFSFSYIAYGALPGFFTSPVQPHESPVRYKGWTENTIYLNGYQGKTIMLLIKVADCTYAVHFGYAYIDVSSKCDNSLVGETYCAQDTAINITAPSGYQSYNWYNGNFSQLLGTQQLLHLQPPPPSGTALAVELIPYPGYGCKDTLEVNLQDTLTAIATGGPDIASCNFNPVRLGISPVGGMVYNWSPSYGLNDSTISNPFALPASDTTYILTIQSMGGGCLSRDTVKVFTRNIDNSLELIGEQRYCLGNGPNPVLKVLPVNSVQWYKDDLPIPGATQLSYTCISSGSYSASLISDICTDPIRTRSIDIVIDTALAGMTYPPIDVAFNFPIRLQARGRDFANSVLWMPNTNLDDAHNFEPYFRGLHEQLYTIEIKTLTGCTTIDTQLVKTHKEIAIYVPTVFTPGGDGTNDYLRPLLLGFEKVKYFRIFNRWGKMIYETQTDLPGWDGRIGNILQETQTVIWMIEAVDIDGKTHFKKGSTLLIR